MIRNSIYLILFINSWISSFGQNTPEEYEKMYQSRIRLERINDVYIPLNIEDAMLELDRLTDKKTAKSLLELPEDTIASKLHFNLGRWMQINWGLEEGSRLAHNLKSRGLSFPDDMQDLIIRCWYRHLGNQPLDDQKLIESYVFRRKMDYAKKLSKFKIDTIAVKSVKN